MTAYSFKTIEPAVLDFWKDAKIYELLVQRNMGKKKFYYLDGPPYTTGKIHIGHAWGKALRDSLMRYKRMQGFDVWDRPGFDMHGLPIEVSVEKELGIKDKKEIVNKFGLQKFIEECQKYSLAQLWPMVDDFKRLGVWMDWQNPYMTIKNEYIEGAWWALAQADAKKLLYLGKKAMTWCPRCATALAKHELEYDDRTDESIFVKLPIVGKNKEFLIVWTTTPWTIPFNLAVMVNPKVQYSYVDAEGEVWIVATKCRERVGKATKRNLLEKNPIKTVFGKDLLGLKYGQPFKDEVAFHRDNKEKAAYSVVLSDKYVSIEDGSGLVHCAPGCGPEDFEVGKEYGLSPFNEADDHGCFSEKMGSLAGLVAKVDDVKFIELLDAKGLIAAQKKVKHEYAHCWRCKTPVIFRATDQWFLGMEKLRDKMVEKNQKVYWVPDWAGNRQFDSWLKSLQDWCISRQRFWGVPLPIWTCSCGKHKVVGTRAELKKLSGKELENLHRPWIDQVTFACECGKEMVRVPDVLDVWLDSGVGAWATLNYPSDPNKFKELGWPDVILEGKDQIRGWFNSLMCMSMVSFGEVPYKAVYMHGFINDAQGRKMSKSLKNFITPYEIIEVYGADTLRYYQIGAAQPGLDLNFNHDDAKIKYRNLSVLWNVHNFVREFAQELKVKPIDLDRTVMHSLFGVEERYMHSKLQSTIKHVTELFETYHLNEVPSVVEDLYLTLSRSYIQMVREKAAIGDENERKVVFYTIATCLVETLKLLAPIAPFITEQMWQNLKGDFGLGDSVHLTLWPKVNVKEIDVKLEAQMGVASAVMQSILAAREKAKISVRWPIKVVQVVSHDDAVLVALEELEDIIKTQTNCKEVHGHKEFVEVKLSVKPNQGMLGKTFGAKSPKVMRAFEKLAGGKVIESLAKEGKFSVKIDGETLELNKDHIVIERDVPKRYVECEFKNGLVYLDTQRTDDLEAEGFAREVMRRVQQMRKDAGLKKTDKIELYVQGSAALAGMLKRWVSRIQEKCGAKECVLDTKPPNEKYDSSAEEKIKDETVNLFLDKA